MVKICEKLIRWMTRNFERKRGEYGYRGPMNKSYICDRFHHVIVNRICTENKLLLTGVPQGSKLGPFRFLLYINDLDTSSGGSKVTRFADDSTLLNAEKNRAFSSIQEDIDAVSDWLVANRLTVIEDSCELMLFGNIIPLEINVNPRELQNIL